MKKWIFESWAGWWKYTSACLMRVLRGFLGVCWSIVGGIMSLCVCLWRSAVRFVGKYPNVALGGFLVLVFLVWLVMFAKARAMKNGLEAQRDSIAWHYKDFKDSHGYE